MLFGLFLSNLVSGPALAASFYEDFTTYQDPVNDDASWAISSPAPVGLDEKLLEKAAAEFAALPFSHSMLVVRKNTLAFERYFHGMSKSSSNNVNSASKSILGASVGIAIEKGFLKGLDQPVTDFLPSARPNLTLRHLLTMTAGIQWTEDVTEYDLELTPNWVDSILALPYPDLPGAKWNYSTGLTHLLSAVIEKATGQSLAAFTRANIFAPLGIADEHWGQDPQGVSSGGYNLYLTPREMAKFGLLYLNGGEWRGKQIVPKHWVADSIRPHLSPRPGFDYGLLFWQKRISGHDVKFAWGYGGQLIYLIPALEMVVVFTTNFDGADPNFQADALLAHFLLTASH